MLADALAAVRRGNASAALAALLAAWRTVRAPRLGELVELVGRQAARGRPPLAGTTLAAFEASWQELQRAGDPADVARLLVALPKGKNAVVRGRIAKLSERGADPRVAMAFVDLVRAPPDVQWVRGAALPIWNDLFGVIERAADPRTVGAIRSIPWIVNSEAPSPFDVGPLRSRTVKRALAIAAVIPDAPALDDEALRACDAIASALDPPDDGDGDALLQRIYADPFDLEPRRVYADWLLERGDPRGELIALQLKRPIMRKPSTREETLLRIHQRAWVGALGPDLKHARFEHGFLYGVVFDGALEHADDPALATVVELRAWITARRDGAALASPCWRALREVGTFQWEGLAGLLDAADRPLEFTRIAIHDTVRPPPDLAALPALRVLDMRMCRELLDTDAAVAFLRAPVFRTLDTFYPPQSSTPAWISAFPRSEVRAIAIGGSWITLRLERDPVPYLAIHVERHVKAVVDELVSIARWWPTDLIPRVRLVVGADWNEHPADLAKLLDATRAIDPEATLATLP